MSVSKPGNVPGSRGLLVATQNKKKLEELRHFFSGLDVNLLYLADFPRCTEVPENGKTFEENACLKAAGYADQTGLLTLAEDSGLCCDALEGAPGIYSARFSGESKNDLENNQKLLRLLRGVPDNCRGAHYTCAIALAVPGELIGVVQGEVYGVIARESAGANGFGYDPIFYYPSFALTFGQVDPEMKNKVSHRANAFVKAKALVEEYLGRGSKGCI